MEDYLIISEHKDAPQPRLEYRASLQLAKEFAEAMVKQGWTCNLFIRHSKLTIEVASEKSATQIEIEAAQQAKVEQAVAEEALKHVEAKPQEFVAP